MRYAFTLNGRTHHVTLEEHAEGPRFLVDGEPFDVAVIKTGKGQYTTTVDGEERSFTIAHGGVHEGPHPLDLEVRRAKPEVVRAGGGSRKSEGRIKPPMPGKVVEIHVAEGDEVTEGQTILVLEAMKMQNDLKAPIAGKVAKINVQSGANVDASTVMIEIEPQEE